MNKLLTLMMLIILTGCATIVKGTKQLITVNCNVDGAKIFLDGAEIGVTPFVGEVKKNKKVLLIQKKGYKDYTVALTKSLEGMFWGNIITGGTLGSITDFASGAAYVYSPSSFQVDLIADGMSLDKFKEIYELKKFAMVNMSQISIDLSHAEGPYLNTLMKLAKMEGSSSDINLIRENLEYSAGDQVTFGKLMVKSLNI